MIGLLVAITPMVLYTASILNPSGIETASSLAFAASLLRISRAPERVPRWVWITCALSGTVAILAGPIGLVLAAAAIVLPGALLAPAGVRALHRAHPKALPLTALVLAAAAAVALGYSQIAGFSAHVGISPIRLSLRQGLGQLPTVLEQAVGTFGDETVSLPLAGCCVWWLFVLIVIAGAAWLGDRRERLVLAGVLVLVLAFPVLFWAWVDRFTGFTLRGREVLPVILLIPLVAGEILSRHSGAIGQRRAWRHALRSLLVLVAAFQAYAWGVSARAAPHDVTLIPTADWNPPLGWVPWLTLAALGVFSVLAFTAGAVPPRTAATTSLPGTSA